MSDYSCVAFFVARPKLPEPPLVPYTAMAPSRFALFPPRFLAERAGSACFMIWPRNGRDPQKQFVAFTRSPRPGRWANISCAGDVAPRGPATRQPYPVEIWI